MSICKIKCEKTQKIYNCVKSLNDQIISALEKYAAPILLLIIRLWMANIFFKSGLTKIANIDSTISLFEYEYALPIISPAIAAYFSIAFELGCSVLLALGLASRLVVLPLIAMTLVIQLLVLQNSEHFYWLFLFCTIFVFGGGKLSADCLLKQAACKLFPADKPSMMKRVTNLFK
ncbi:MAG: DoxX family protein [Pseudomonadota bacterium]